MPSLFLVSLGAAGLVLWVLLRTGLAWRIATDTPNHRSLHTAPVPRAGGWGVVPVAIIVASSVGAGDVLLATTAGILFAISYADDRLNLPIIVRLPVQTAAVTAWMIFGPVQFPVALALLATFAIVWIVNLFNFMDGADGLAGGMAVVAFFAYGIVAAGSGPTPLAVWSISLAGTSAGFLLFNFNPARIFLGDAGSVPMGFFVGAFGVWGWSAGAWPVWFPFLVAGPFFFDATATILRRMLRREAFWRAHREHYYQRLIRSGWSHRRTACFEYMLMTASASLAVAMLGWSAPAQYVGLVAAAVAYGLLGRAVDRRWTGFLEKSGAVAQGGPSPSRPA